MDAGTLTDLILFSLTALGAGLTALWLGLTIWTWQDMRARSRDPLAQVAATSLVFLIPGFGSIVYVMLRPRETLADAYERSLEEEALLQEIEEKPACPGCGRPTKHHWVVCPYCHTRLKKNCTNCNEVLELNWNLCPACATPQIATEEATSIDQQTFVPTGRPKGRSIVQQMNDTRSPYEYDMGENLEFVDD